jgi:hypothetical protein
MKTNSLNGWVRIFGSDKLYQVKIASAVLFENNIQNIEINKQDSSYALFGEIELYVSQNDVVLAKIVLEQNNL